MKVWTFIIRQGQPFHLRLATRLGPALDYDGKFAVWKMMGTAEEAQSVTALLMGPTIQAQVQCHTEEEDAEMVKARFEGEF